MKYIVIAVVALLSCSFLFAQDQTKQKAVLNHTAIYVIDVNKSGNFYKQILGLDTVPEPFHDGKHIWLKTGAHTMLHIIQGADAKKEYYKNQHTCFSVPDIVVFAELLKKKEFLFEDVSGNKQVFSTRTDGVHQLWLQDPDGYWIEVNDDKY